MSVDIVTNSVRLECNMELISAQLYEMEGCNFNGPPHCQQKFLWEESNVTACKLLKPCHYTPPRDDAVNFIGMQREELRVLVPVDLVLRWRFRRRGGLKRSMLCMQGGRNSTFTNKTVVKLVDLQ